MDKYENLGLVGEGSYGMVLKCKHKETSQIVAIKKFLESEDDRMVKKIAMREIRMLKQLRHENLVNLIEVFRRKKRLYLVFEFVDHTVLDDLERCPNGLDEGVVRKVLWQVLRGIEFCHLHNIIHRDIKPENILVSKSGVIKLCDFGFARAMAQPGEVYTDYVATRWYRSPELLVGDTRYGRAVDIWAVGCLVAEMLTGEPLFPGDSDIDQLYHIVKCFGNLTQRHREIFYKNPLFVGMKLPEVRETQPLEKKFPRLSHAIIDIMKQALRLEANDRPTCSQLLRHDFFTKDGFAQKFAQELKSRIDRERQESSHYSGKNKGGGMANSHHDSNTGAATVTNTHAHTGEEPGQKKKKKSQINDAKKENKTPPLDKPKRKLPDPEKFLKKGSTLPGRAGAVEGSANGDDVTGSSHSELRHNHVEPPQQHSSHNEQGAPPMEMPPIQHTSQAPVISPATTISPSSGSSERSSIHPTSIATITNLSFAGRSTGGSTTALPPSPSLKKAPPYGGRTTPPSSSTSCLSSSTLSPVSGKAKPASLEYTRTNEKLKKPPPNFQPKKSRVGLGQHSTIPEKASAQDKGAASDKYNQPPAGSNQRQHRGLSVQEPDANIYKLPEVKGAAANPNKGKQGKGYLAPHITNIDPFQENHHGSDNLPDV